MIRLMLTACCVLALGVDAVAERPGRARYDQCMNKAMGSPDAGINMALAWQADGGGVPARHCEAVGLYELGEYAESAVRLESLVEDMRTGKDMPLVDGRRVTATGRALADMLGQAANAWLMASEIVRAYQAIGQALSLVESGTALHRSLLVDQGRIHAADGDMEAAYDTLKEALDGMRKDTPALALLASAARQTGRLNEAADILSRYRDAFPERVDGLLELGNLRRAQDRLAEARRAFVRVIQQAPDSEEAEIARRTIEVMDLDLPKEEAAGQVDPEAPAPDQPDPD
ncbi:tetratricopeptide repeat protein [Yunchengibacter salinarum]|uniref:tetratricopeptide repeat protein n=1 Tax=Yunchengibacter salinarum TaxID=3133399 RepID=UPI0035B68A57